MLPPVSTMPTLRPRNRAGCSSSAASPRRAGALGDHLLDVEEEIDRLLEVVLTDGDDVGDEASTIGVGERAGERVRRCPRRRSCRRRGGARCARRWPSREAICLDADDLDVGAPRMCRDGHPRDQAAASYWDGEHLDVRGVLEQLERNGAGAGDDRGVVVGGDEHHPPSARGDARPPPPPRGPGRRARPARRASRCGAPSPAASRPASRWWPGCREGGVVGECLRVVSRRHRDHAAGTLLGGEREQLVRAPRSLNDAVNWKFSNFTHTSAPVMSDSVRGRAVGVRSTDPAIRARGGLDVRGRHRERGRGSRHRPDGRPRSLPIGRVCSKPFAHCRGRSRPRRRRRIGSLPRPDRGDARRSAATIASPRPDPGSVRARGRAVEAVEHMGLVLGRDARARGRARPRRCVVTAISTPSPRGCT